MRVERAPANRRQQTYREIILLLMTEAITSGLDKWKDADRTQATALKKLY
jgi:hypothetical protein